MILYDHDIDHNRTLSEYYNDHANKRGHPAVI